ncbi:MAG: DUF87 domain-containing protein [Bacilli bacterium]|nr:DUF87 domain-containing protein [Bacilli bacterium]
MGRIKDFGKTYGTPKPSDIGAAESKEEENVDNIVAAEHISNKEDCEDFASVKTIYNYYRRTFLHNLNSLELCPLQDTSTAGSLSWIKIDKIVYENDVFFSDCLSMVYSSLCETTDVIALLVQKVKGANISLFFGVRDKFGVKDTISKHILQRSISGNLPGLSYQEIAPAFSVNNADYVSCVSGVASLKGEKKKKFTQGVERLINSTDDIPSFSILFLANTIDSNSRESFLDSIRKDYSNLSYLSETTKSTNESSGETFTLTNTTGTNRSKTTNESSTTNQNTTTNTSTCKTEGSSGTQSAVILGQSETESTSTTNGSSKTEGSSATKGNSNTLGDSVSKSEAKASTNNSGSSVQYKVENKFVKDLLSSMDRLIARYDSSERFGLWDFAAYFIADTRTTAIGLASIYKGIITGAADGSQSFAINCWGKEQSTEIQNYICRYIHPKFIFEGKKVSPAIPTTSEELAINMSLPQSSIPGVLVREQVSFGRNVIVDDNAVGTPLNLGVITHLGRVSPKNKVYLNEDLFSSHVFVTGSTGSGKSNTIYYLIDQLRADNKKFLIIEPAKGEYKNVFGGYDDVMVYSTNHNIAPLLKLNPFTFPEGIHVAEHIDRLIDIFNACWPMYAAMPAVLKEAISRAYESCGWNLVTSTSSAGYYPTINDVIAELNTYINSSNYSADSKSDYKGAIGTRLQSLSNGIIGHIFSGDEIENETLFNNNVIIDLSRVGSTETKALIMGFLVMKLGEFRMSEGLGMNLPLRHVTVLEEAHNLLKQTSTAQSQESSNLTGKSVEMISSAIAEMRTYGEGFIIADQSPTMLDKSAISNTNTKIIMSLPNKADRELAAYSIGLDDEQTKEVSKLKTGIGVVYQKGWEEPVLCMIEKFESGALYSMKSSKISNMDNDNLLIKLYEGFSSVEPPLQADIVESLDKSKILSSSKFKIKRLISDASEVNPEICSMAFVYFVGENVFIEASKRENLIEFNKFIKSSLSSFGSNVISDHIETFMNMYIKGCSIMNATPFYDAWLEQTNTSKTK